MNELLSMLVPLETLSGWPAAPNPSILASLAIFVGFPVLVFIIVIAISKIATGMHESRGEDIHASDPLWVGEQQRGVLEASSANPGTQASDEVSAGDAEPALARDAEHAPAGDGAVEGDDTGEHVGG
ncbi:MAG TPA: hypothetical protein VFP81_05375, partial [Propionibacteriaceae bacterium]|nr:hypothetical protein [Propionibacteriaceae bacterium]